MAWKQEEAWLGVGGKWGGQALFGGAETVMGTLYNIANPNNKVTFKRVSSRWGLGLGGGAGLTCICVFKLRGIAWLHGRTIEDWGVNVDLGGKWKHVAKILQTKKFFTHVKIAKAVKGIITNLDEIRDAMHYLYTIYDFDTNGDHPILSFDVPFAGLGLEVSIFKTKGKIFLDL